MASSRVDVKFAAASETIEEDFKDVRDGLGTTGPSGRQVRAAEASVGRAIEGRRRIAVTVVVKVLLASDSIRGKPHFIEHSPTSVWNVSIVLCPLRSIEHRHAVSRFAKAKVKEIIVIASNLCSKAFGHETEQMRYRDMRKEMKP